MCISESAGAIVTAAILKSCYMRMCQLVGGSGSACNRLLSDVFQQSAGLNVGLPVLLCLVYQLECWSVHYDYPLCAVLCTSQSAGVDMSGVWVRSSWDI